MPAFFQSSLDTTIFHQCSLRRVGRMKASLTIQSALPACRVAGRCDVAIPAVAALPKVSFCKRSDDIQSDFCVLHTLRAHL